MITKSSSNGHVARKTSGDANHVGSSAWIQKVGSELGEVDMSMVPAQNVVALDEGVLKEDCKRLEVRLKTMETCLLNPRTKRMQYWDFVILVAMFFTSTVTPYEVCFIWEAEHFDALFFVNIIVNMVFVIDTTFQFFLPYKESPKRGGQMVKNHRKIAHHYLTTWFPIDFISIVPFDYIINFAIMPAVGGGGDNLSLVGATSMLRLLRLIKLVRILRASRIFARWENSISMKYSTRELIALLSGVVLLLHWLSCLLGMTANLMRSERYLELQEAMTQRVYENENLTASSLEEPLCFGCVAERGITSRADPLYGMEKWCDSVCYTPCEMDTLARLRMPFGFETEIQEQVLWLQSQESWVCRNVAKGHIREMPFFHGEVYVAGLMIALLQMSGGVGSVVPTNLAENIIFLIGIAVGSVMWAIVVGTICGLSATGDPFSKAFKQNMDQLNYFLEDMNMEIELRHKAREYLRNAKDLGKKTAYNEVVEKLSPEVKSECVLHMSANTLKCVDYFKGLNNKMALVELAMRLKRFGFASREKLSTARLNILMRGVAARAGKIMTNQGDVENMPHWGEDLLLTSNALRDRRPAAALTYVEVITLEKRDLDEVCEAFVDIKQQIHMAKVFMAMKRSMVVVADYIRDHAGDEFAAGAAPRGARDSEMSAYDARRAAELADPLDSIPGLRSTGDMNSGAFQALMAAMNKQSLEIGELKAGLNKLTESKAFGANPLAA